jgi:flagellar hook-associated protein 1 FlgK
MTIPAFTGLQTALRGLEANQAGINTTGNNIANANTPGYTRETPDFTESTDLTLTAFSNVTGAGVQLGTGVDVTTINRIRDQFLDIQYRAQNSASSNAQTNASELGDVQTAVDEPSTDGISAALSNFWSAWSQLAQSPTGTSSAAAKQSVIETGQTLAQTFNTVDAQMASVQSQAQQQYNTLTAAGGQVSQYANQIASLNTEISQATQAGQQPNDLLDQRDQLLDELSGMAQVSVTDNSDGTVSVGFGGAASPLVSGSTVNWPQTLGSSPGGQLGALSSLAGATGEIQTLRTALNGVANDVVTAVNGLQPSSTPFFSGNSAASIAVAATASTLTASSSSGSGDVAGSEAALSGGTADQAFSAFVGQLGNAVSSAQSTASTASSVLSAIDNQRQSVSGVSLDEEMTNLITYQQGYQASARMMTTIDTVLNTLINSTGAGL